MVKPQVTEETVVVIPIECVIKLPTQPRVYFDPEKLLALGNSIKEVGQAQPVLVRKIDTPVGKPQMYQLIDGERRWQSIQLVGLPTIRAIVIDLDNENDVHMLSVISNFNREDHTHAEKVRAVFDLKVNGVPVEKIAVAVGKSEVWVNQYFTLSRLDKDILKFLDPPTPDKDRLSFQIALRIATLKTKEDQHRFFKKVQEEREKGTSHTLMIQVVRRMMESGNYERRTHAGKRVRQKKASDHRVSFEALPDRIKVLIMKLEDYPKNVLIDYARRNGGSEAKQMAETFRTCAELLTKHSETLEALSNCDFVG